MISSGKKSLSEICDKFRQKSERNRWKSDDSFCRYILHQKFVGNNSDHSDKRKNISDEISRKFPTTEFRRNFPTKILHRNIPTEHFPSETSDHNPVGDIRQISDEICFVGLFYLFYFFINCI